MISIDQIRAFYPASISGNTHFDKHLLKEYMQLSIMDFLSRTSYVKYLAFIGGTCLRMAFHINRFSEDLDFDCKNMSEDDFMRMTDAVVKFLQNMGYRVETRDKPNPHLNAFRRNLFFPELLFDVNLSGHREERFLIKVEAQDQGIPYQTESRKLQGCGYLFMFPTPPVSILCAMKVAAFLTRAKGRDIYDLMFLLSLTMPDYDFLQKKGFQIHNLDELKRALLNQVTSIDLAIKQKDFSHLLLMPEESRRILDFPLVVESLI